jgi:hypothetical protein
MSTYRLGRRRFLQAGGISLSGGALAARQDNRIIQENSRPGTNQWQLQRTEFEDPVTLMSYPLNRRLRSVAA